MDIFQKAQQLAQDYLKGFSTADALQVRMLQEDRENKLLGNKGLGYGESVLGPQFKKELKKEGISARQTPVQFLGAYTSRALIDVANDGTRTYWWRWNHPLAIAQRGVEMGVNKNVLSSPTLRAAVALGVATPAIAAAGTYDITNPEEQFRPKGFAQTYSEKGSEDRRQTGQPVQELFERFFLGRTGDPLKYSTAKEDIPDLTPERYGNYMRFLYQEKGLGGLGIVKGTMENLEGNPELRMLGYPVNAPMVGGFAGGTLLANVAAKTASSPKQKAVRALAGAVTGSIGGVMAGNVINEVVASGNRPTLPTQTEYQNISAGRI
jgi:hypothetical protein